MKKIYNLILEFDSNVDPSVLTFGSLLFDFIDKNKLTFDYDKFRLKARTYYLYSEENLCKTYKWLKDNGFIYYSYKYNTYFVSDMIKDLFI